MLMRKFFLLAALLTLGFATASAECADGPYDLYINGVKAGTFVDAGTSPDNLPQLNVAASVKSGDKLQFCNASCDVFFFPQIIEKGGEVDGSANFTVAADHAVCSADGCYNFWWKKSMGNDRLYIGTDGNCGGQQGGGDNPGGGGTEQPDAYWYYKGYIDGGDLENEAGGFNIFNCGTAHLDVASDAYLFVMFQKKGVQGVQYMTTAYVDGPTHATMVTTGGEKMHVRAGSYTLYLYDNGDGSVELSTEQLSGKTLVKENCNASTNIQLVVEKLDLNAPMFDVLGRKVNADYKGIVIQNGKKFIR